MDLTEKQAQLLTLIQQGEGREGIYTLAKRAGRPYRRVYDHVQELADRGLVELTPGRSTRAVTRVLARRTGSEAPLVARPLKPR